MPDTQGPTLNTFTGGGDGLQMIVYHKKTEEYFAPAVLDGVTWELHRKGAPGKLSFKVVKDDILKMEYGDTVDVSWNGTQFFHGFIFEKKRNKNKQWDCLAYDQIRYLLNKDSFSYIGKKANEVIKELAEDYELLVGDLDDTGFVIEKRREPNTTILDMIQNALDLTMIHTNKMYVLYDDCGKLTLKDIEKLQTNLLIDSDTAQDYAYTGTIDKGVYNLIKLNVDEGENGHKVYYAPASNKDYENSETRKQWGVLELTQNANPHNQFPQDLANRLLENYNKVARTLSIKGAAGDLSVRGGSMVFININFGETDWQQSDDEAKLSIVETVTHRFSNFEHTMDMDVRNDKITGVSNASGGGGGAGGGSNSSNSNNSNGSNATQASQNIERGADAFVGATMPSGQNGCVEAATRVGGYNSPFLAREARNGVAGVSRLVSDAHSYGVPVIPYDESKLEVGDTIVYGNNKHVVISSGGYSYVGNSSSRRKVVRGSDYREMGGLHPTRIIKTSHG